MKIKRIVKKFLLCFFIILSATGCLKRDNMEDINIYTTVYPIEYLVEQIYGDYSNIKSIYPNGIDVAKYNLSKKQIRDYSKSEMLVYNGLTKEKKIAAKFINQNKNIKIIDVTQGLEYSNSVDELWVSPSNYLMMAQNIKNNLKEYIYNAKLKDEINEKYKELKVNISNIDAELKIIAENSSNKTIIVNDKLYKFLEKYGFEVVCLDENSPDFSSLSVKKAKNLITSGQNDYIFIKKDTAINNTVKKLQKETGVELATLDSGTNLTEEQRNENIDYISILKENMELIKKEMYN